MKLTTKGRCSYGNGGFSLKRHFWTNSLKEISLRQNISLAYLEQIFIKLKNKKLVTSQRGAGGYLLERASV